MSHTTPHPLDQQDEMEPARETAAVYARVSSVGQLGRDGDDDGDGYSLPAQAEACKRKASELGAELGKVYLERAESARSDNRPVLQQMMRELPKLGVKYLIVHKVDRLARNRLDDAVLYQKLVGMGITLVSATENIDDTAPGRLMHGMLAAFNEYYSHNLSNEVLKGLRRKHELGGTPFKPPIGYVSAQRQPGAHGVRGVVLDRKRAKLVKAAFELYVTGNWSLRGLASYLAEQGLRSRGTPKYPERILGDNRIHEMLKNPYYIGIVKWGGRSYKGTHPTLVDPETFERVQAILAAQRIGGERPQLHHHYLRSTVICDKCKGRLLFGRHRSRSGDHYDYFSCTNRTARQRHIHCDASGHYSVPKVEDHVEQLYAGVYLSPDVMEQIRRELREEIADRAGLVERQAERHERTLKQIEAKQEKLVQLYYDDLVTIEVFEREQTKLKAEAKAAERLRRIAVVQSEQAEAALDEALQRLKNIAQVYRDGTPIERRILNRAIFQRIEIGEDGEITGTALTPTYQALAAWNPNLGKPTRHHAQEPSNLRSDFVRPTYVGAAVGVAMVVALLSFTAGLQRTAAGFVHLGGSGLGVFQANVAEPTTSVLPSSLVGRLRRLPQVTRATPLLLVVEAVRGEPAAIVFGAEPRGFFTRSLVITAGAQPAAGTRAALVGDRLAAQLHLRAGGHVTIEGRAFPIAGVYHSGILFEDAGAVLPLAVAQQLTDRPREETDVVVDLAPGVHASSAGRAIERELPGTRVITDPEQALRVGANATLISQAILVIVVIALIVGGLSVTNTMAMSVMERRGELGLLSTVGWSPARVAALIFGEGVGGCMRGAAGGLLIGILGARALVAALGAGSYVSPAITAWGLGRGLLIGVAIGMLGGVYPAWRVTRMTPLRALAGT